MLRNVRAWRTGRRSPIPCAFAVAIALWLLADRTAHAQSPQPSPPSTMQQLMQAIVFPNANVLFATERDDPASIRRDERPSLSTNPLTGLYGGWQAVENSALALAEAADLLTLTGRRCANGRPVPSRDADWQASVDAFRAAALAIATAARTRNRATLGALTDELTTACSRCHRVYRVQGNPCVNAGARP